MTTMNQPITYQGGCHCGAVRFSVTVDQHEAIDCNCSICHKKGFIHLIVPPEQFTLLSGADVLTTYTFNTNTAKHTFCRICGIHPFYRPRSHPQSIDVNLRCLDDDVLSRFARVSFDGANWEENIDTLKSDYID
ncbi:GFA family protein [Coleofasciculus sp. G1-WW12-02]|uniref:GFA family protein n=1 Tax=unclassified Coleofasciculus TaxID=2692782 RepID=UPI004063FE27